MTRANAVLPSMFSDHDAIHIGLNMCRSFHPQRTIIFHKFKAIYSGMLSAGINGCDLFINQTTSLDGVSSQYVNVISNVIQKHTHHLKATPWSSTLQFPSLPMRSAKPT